jgi:endoglucanase
MFASKHSSSMMFRLFALFILLEINCSALAAPDEAVPPALEKMTPINAWAAVDQMTPGINIGNTLENTVQWETGWGNPPITKAYVLTLAHLGFKTVRLPIAWDTFAKSGQITPRQFRRVSEVVNWITDAGMFCVINIHWDGGWIDSDDKKRFPNTYHTFSPEAERKFSSYWDQIARFFAGKNQRLIFESLNEESTFDNAGSPEKAYETLNHVNQLFVDTVRKTGGNNADRLLIVVGYTTDIAKTCQRDYNFPKDTVPSRLLLSIHYYTPWLFVGLSQDAPWGKVQRTWGSPRDVKQLNDLFDTLNAFCTKNDIPAFIGEFSMCSNKEEPSRIRWLTSVARAAIRRKMIPVLWDTGGLLSRRAPYEPKSDLTKLLEVEENSAIRP